MHVRLTWAVGAEFRVASYLIITTGQLGFCKNLMLNLKRKTWKRSFAHLTTFSKVGRCPAAAGKSPHRFVLQYILTFEVDVLKYWRIIYFDKTNVKPHSVFLFWGEMKKKSILWSFTVKFSSNVHRWVYTSWMWKWIWKRRGKKTKKGALIEWAAPSCELDPTHVMYK